jgi:carboxypeptidase family protein
MHGSGTPIRGVFVSLLDARGDRQRGYLTDEAGRFVFRALRAGTFTLRAERIGYKTVDTEPISVQMSETRDVPIRMAVTALRLPDITIQRDQRCVTNPQNAVETARVWEEVRKALTVAVWLQGIPQARFRVRMFERELTAALDTVGPEEMDFKTIRGWGAFGALAADSLSRFGFVQRSGENVLYFGPDAELLTTPEFLDQHCFRLERSSSRPGLLGLTFEPRRDRRLPDIKGALWLEEATGALKYVDYEFTNLEFSVNRRFANGWTNFEQLPNGAWIVRHWELLLPTIEARGHVPVVVGAKRHGGEVFDALIGSSSALARLPVVNLTGTVYDSLRTAPLANARVFLPGTNLEARTDSTGKFIIADVPGGDYYVGVEHVRLDSIPVRLPLARIRVDASTGPLRIATPSRDALLARLCGERELSRMLRRAPGGARREMLQPEQWISAVQVDVIDDATGGGVSEATVRLRWNDPRKLGSGPLGSGQQTLRGETNAFGRVTLCGIIDSQHFFIDVQRGRRTQTVGPFTVPPERIMWPVIKFRSAVRTGGAS